MMYAAIIYTGIPHCHQHHSTDATINTTAATSAIATVTATANIIIVIVSAATATDVAVVVIVATSNRMKTSSDSKANGWAKMGWTLRVQRIELHFVTEEYYDDRQSSWRILCFHTRSVAVWWSCLMRGEEREAYLKWRCRQWKLNMKMKMWGTRFSSSFRMRFFFYSILPISLVFYSILSIYLCSIEPFDCKKFSSENYIAKE